MDFALVFVVFCACIEMSLAAHLKEIPKRFEVKDVNARTEFRKYINEISQLAKKANVTVTYKVMVEVSKPKRKHWLKNNKMGKRSKKYNVPLKKKSMKLSNLEMILRKHVESMVKTMTQEDNNLITTEQEPQIPITRSMFNGKYKPIIGQVRTNYSKIVRPVKKKIITLTL